MGTGNIVQTLIVVETTPNMILRTVQYVGGSCLGFKIKIGPFTSCRFLMREDY